MKSIISAIDYIHSFGIAHRDLKPGTSKIENILFANKQDFSSVKIIDFGLSAKYDMLSLIHLNNKCGTFIFMAPEVMQNFSYSNNVDIWSIGIILYMLLSGGKHPLYVKTDNVESFSKKIMNPTWKFPPNFSKSILEGWPNLSS